tara:strand:- start:5981 stop:7105 length:1125 start_codon:yes stop_codon:yes gene_type:complete
MGSLIQKQLNGRNHVMPKRIDEETRKKLLQKYKRNENNNYHTANYLLLAETYGTPQEVAEVKEILKRKGDQGWLNDKDWKWLRDSRINEYYINLENPALAELRSMKDELIKKKKLIPKAKPMSGIGDVYGDAYPRKYMAEKEAKKLGELIGEELYVKRSGWEGKQGQQRWYVIKKPWNIIEAEKDLGLRDVNPGSKLSDEKLWLLDKTLRANANKYRDSPGEQDNLENILFWVNEMNATPAKKKKARDIVRRSKLNDNIIRKDNGDYDWWISNISKEQNFLLDPENKKRIANYDSKMDKETFREYALHDLKYSKLFQAKYGHFPTEHSLSKEKPPLIAPRPKPKPTIKKTKTIKSYSEKRTPKIGKTINRRTLM